MKIKSFLAGGALVLASIIVAVVILVLVINQQTLPIVVESQGVTRFGALHLTEAGGTATPVLRVNQTGTGKIGEFLDSGTPALSLLDGGGVEVAVPTAVATAPPALQVDSAGVSNIFEARAAATPMVSISSGGDITLENGEQLNNSTDGFVGFVGGQLWSTTTTTATDGLTITPTVYSAYNLDSASEVTITLASCTEGGPLIIVGDDANNININDTNIRSEDGGASVIGQYDIQLWFCIDAEWLLVSESTDS